MFSSYIRFILGGLIAAMIITGPIGYALYRKAESRNVRVVREGVLYRSGQLTLSGLKQVIKDHRIKTVVTLRTAREAGLPHPALEEEVYCRNQQLNYHRIQMKPWVKVKGKAPADEGVRQFCAIMNDPANHPVLVHCYAGKHRTGAYCAIYRMEFEDWANEQAIEEMIANGYDHIDEHEDLEGYLRGFRPSHSVQECRHETCCPNCKSAQER